MPQINQWDDHEVTNNWYPGEILTDARYTEKRVDVLAGRAFQAFHEYVPLDPRRAVDGRVYRRLPYGPHVELFVIDMRTYRDANSVNTAPLERILGEKQARWLVDSLASSKATWKIVASDMPIGVHVPDGTAWEAVANGVAGPPSGREAEIAWVLSQLRSRKVRNVVWLTADVHYTAAHHYSPDRAAFTEFDPFWEFVSGPLHAGAFGPNPLDPTFGPEAVFVQAPPAANTSPLDGFQHFGEVEVAPGGGELRVALRGHTGGELWSTTCRRTAAEGPAAERQRGGLADVQRQRGHPAGRRSPPLGRRHGETGRPRGRIATCGRCSGWCGRSSRSSGACRSWAGPRRRAGRRFGRWRRAGVRCSVTASASSAGAARGSTRWTAPPAAARS